MVTHHGRDQIAKVRVGRQARRHDHRLPRDDHRRLRRLPHAADADRSRRWAAFVMSGVYEIPAVQTDITGVFTNKFATDAIRGAGRPEATHMIEVADGPARRRAGHGPARDAAQELHPAGRLPARDRDRHRLRLRQLPRPRWTSCSSTSTSDAFRASRRSCAREGVYRGIGFSHLHRDLRPRALARHRPAAASACRPAAGSRRMVRVHRHRRGDRLHRHLAARPGPRDGLRPDRRRPARDRPAAGRRHPRRHRDRPVAAWAPTARARSPSAASRSRARPRRSPTRRRRSSPTSSRPTPRTSSCATASGSCAARRTRA